MVRHTEKSGAKPRSGQAEKKPASAKGAAKPGEKQDRIAKVLARAGVASRREVERLIGLGKVAVNGRILDTPATLVGRDDIVTVDGQVIGEAEPTRLWRYHKPVGLVTTHKDPENRPTVFQHLPDGLPRVISIGRLDINTEGLLLLTNDGELSRALELPANAWKRTYRARALGRTTQAKLDTLKDGVTIEGVNYGPIEAKLDKVQEKDEGRANLWITVSVHEGKYREVRKVLESLGLKVNRLIRLAYGPFQLGTLEQGAAEEVGPRVIRELLADYIPAENMPTGDRVTTPLSKPSRRPAPSTRIRPDNAIADPNKKPSRVRAQAEAPADAGEDRRPPREPREPKKPGWAKAAPRQRTDRPKPGAPKKTGWVKRETGGDEGGEAKRPFFRPRPERDGEERRGPGGPRAGGRPGFKPRGEGRPERDGEARRGPGAGGGYKGRGDGPREGRSEGFKPRGEGRPGEDRRGPRSGGKPGGYKPRAEGGGEGGGFKPRGQGRPGGKPGGAKFGPRPGGRPGGASGGKRPGGPKPPRG